MTGQTMTIAIIGMIVALVVIAAMSAKKGKPKPKPVNGADWRIEYSPGMPSRPTLQGNGWFFDFPTDPNSHVHYVPWHNPPSLVGKSRITARFAVMGGDFIPQEFPDGRPATVSLLIQRRGDDWSAQGKYASYRWYSAQVVDLSQGAFELSETLDVAQWGDVYGGKDATAFAAALWDTDNIGLVFGSAGGRGHGVFATEPSKFTLLELVVS